MSDDTQKNKELEENSNHIDYNFLHEDQKNKTEETFSDKFDLAFNQSSPAIQNYILSDKFEENIKLICKIEKLDDEKANVIVENVAVSVLVGILPINEAKNTLIESFKASGILLEDFTAGLILKNIDAYILSDVRKQILQGKTENSKEIRHLTLKQSTEEKEKEELRKILLERTGNLTGKGEILVGYKERDVNINANQKTENQNKETNRESLLAKLNLKNVSDTDKIKERMIQIKKEEEERLAEKELKKKEEESLREQRDKENKAKQETFQVSEENKENEDETIKENQDISKIFAETIEEKMASPDNKEEDLDALRKERGERESNNQAKNPTYYTREMQSQNKDQASDNTNNKLETSFDPYRETL